MREDDYLDVKIQDACYVAKDERSLALTALIKRIPWAEVIVASIGITMLALALLT